MPPMPPTEFFTESNFLKLKQVLTKKKSRKNKKKPPTNFYNLTFQ